MKKSLLIGAALLCLNACATTQTNVPAIAESKGRVVLADSHIGERYEAVMERAITNFVNDPQCEERKVSLRKQRKAFHYEVCGFQPEDQLLLDSPVEEVVYHFIDSELVRVDVRALGELQLLDNVKEDMAAVFGSSAAIQTTLADKSYQWVAKQQVAGVRAGTGASEGNVHIRLVDGTLVKNAPWLAVE